MHNPKVKITTLFGIGVLKVAMCKISMSEGQHVSEGYSIWRLDALISFVVQGVDEWGISRAWSRET